MTSAAFLSSAADGPEAGMALKVMLDAGPAAVAVARRTVLDFLAPHGLSPKAAYAVELVLEEVLMNIGWHAYDEQSRHEARLTIRVGADEVLMRFEDDGSAFDPTRQAESAPPGSLADARPGGLGLRLVRRFARHIGYERRDGSNRLTVGLGRQ